MLTVLFVFYMCIAHHTFGEVSWMDWAGFAIIAGMNLVKFSLKYNEKHKDTKIRSFSLKSKAGD